MSGPGKGGKGFTKGAEYYKAQLDKRDARNARRRAAYAEKRKTIPNAPRAPRKRCLKNAGAMAEKNKNGTIKKRQKCSRDAFGKRMY